MDRVGCPEATEAEELRASRPIAPLLLPRLLLQLFGVSGVQGEAFPHEVGNDVTVRDEHAEHFERRLQSDSRIVSACLVAGSTSTTTCCCCCGVSSYDGERCFDDGPQVVSSPALQRPQKARLDEEVPKQIHARETDRPGHMCPMCSPPPSTSTATTTVITTTAIITATLTLIAVVCWARTNGRVDAIEDERKRLMHVVGGEEGGAEVPGQGGEGEDGQREDHDVPVRVL
jgi:hypothetical protein